MAQQGDEELQSYLATLKGRMREDLARTIKEQADELAEAIRAAAPAGETSNLKDSVRVEPGRDDLEYIVVAGGKPTTISETRGPYDYSLAVEFGTQREPARPFFWPTYRARRENIRKEIMHALEQAMES